MFRQFMERADRLVQELINESLVDVIYRQRANRFAPFHRLLHTHPAILMFECAIAEVLVESRSSPGLPSRLQLRRIRLSGGCGCDFLRRRLGCAR